MKEARQPFEHVVWGSQVDQIGKAAAENKPFLLKIHGDAEERTNRVLTKSEYDKHYAPDDPTGLRAQLSRLFAGRTLLFVGCSLGADRTMDVLFDLLQEATGREHYVIVEMPASARKLTEKQHKLGQRGILPIWYPTGRHDLIEPLLRWIASLQPAIPGDSHDVVARGLRVFLCHSSGDKKAVRQLYEWLSRDGVEPWLDEENLIPGQEWEMEIPSAVRASDVVLICLSPNAVNKRGYVQKEISFALDVAAEQPEGSIFLIPVRLETCAVPERLRRWQWVDLFDERGYDRLIQALAVQSKRLETAVVRKTRA